MNKLYNTLDMLANTCMNSDIVVGLQNKGPKKDQAMQVDIKSVLYTSGIFSTVTLLLSLLFA